MTEDTNPGAISVTNLKKRFGDREVIRGMSFDVQRGCRVGIIGPSGGGKSTLLRCLIGLENFDEGHATIADTKLSPGEHPKAALTSLRQKTGIVFQEWHLFAHMSVLANLMEAPLHVQKRNAAEVQKEALDLLEMVGLSHRAQAYPKEMSGGEKQRAAIARALAIRPKVLFMDEPTSALDPPRVESLGQLLSNLTESGDLTLAIVTHDVSFVRRFCTHAVVLMEGNVEQFGEVKSLLANPASERLREFLSH